MMTFKPLPKKVALIELKINRLSLSTIPQEKMLWIQSKISVPN